MAGRLSRRAPRPKAEFAFAAWASERVVRRRSSSATGSSAIGIRNRFDGGLEQVLEETQAEMSQRELLFDGPGLKEHLGRRGHFRAFPRLPQTLSEFQG